MGYVVEHLTIVNDRDSRPPGYTIIEQTIDTSKFYSPKLLENHQASGSKLSENISIAIDYMILTVFM